MTVRLPARLAKTVFGEGLAESTLAGLGWAIATLAAFATLPWVRTGRRDFFQWAADRVGLVLLSQGWEAWVVVGAAAAAALASVAPLRQRTRGLTLVAAGVAGVAATVRQLVEAGEPMGAGALVTLLGFTVLSGIGLSRAGLVWADGFIASSILLAAGFVAVFILYPLVLVLHASVVVDGRFTLQVLERTLRSPIFLLVRNPAGPGNELTVAAWVAGLGAGAGFAAAMWRHRQPLAALGWAGAGAIGGFVASLLVTGFGAVRNSLVLAITVGAVSTALGFGFALLGARSLKPAGVVVAPLVLGASALGAHLLGGSGGVRGPLAQAAVLVIGFVVAVVVYRRMRMPLRALLSPFSVLPIITPPFLLGLAMIYMFGRRGFVTHQLLGLSTNAFFGPLGVGVAQVLAFTPIAYLVLAGVVQALDPALEEAAHTLGASRGHLFRTVTWPLVRPGIANAFLLVMIESLADFGNPIILGGGKPFLATEVFFAIDGRYDPHEAAVYGVTLLVIALGVFAAQQAWVGRRQYTTVTGRPTAGRHSRLPAGLEWGLIVLFTGWVALAVSLYGSVLVGGFVKLWGFDHTFTLQNYRALAKEGLSVYLSTTRLAALSMVPSALFGFVLAYLVVRHRFPGRRWLEAASMLSFATPGTVMGIGYILAFNQGPLLLTGTSAIIVLAFIFRNMPVAIRSAVAALHQLDAALEEASATLRATSLTTLRRVVLPLLVPALLSGLVFSYVRAMTAISQVIFLISPGNQVVTTLILSWVEYGTLGRAAALTSVLILSMAAVIAALYPAMRRLGGPGRGVAMVA